MRVISTASIPRRVSLVVGCYVSPDNRIKRTTNVLINTCGAAAAAAALFYARGTLTSDNRK